MREIESKAVTQAGAPAVHRRQLPFGDVQGVHPVQPPGGKPGRWPRASWTTW